MYSLLARLILLSSGLAASRVAASSIPDYPFIPVSEPGLAALSILASALVGLASPRASWLLLLSTSMAFAATLASGRPSYTLLVLGILGSSASLQLAGWRRSRARYEIDRGRALAWTGSIAFIAGGFIVFATTSFSLLADALTRYFEGLPSDVGVFYSTVTSTVAWRFLAYTLVGMAIFRVLELMVDVTTKLGRGGEVLASYDARSQARRESSSMILMKGGQYAMLSEGFSLVATILYYPLLYTAITGLFTLAGMNLEGASTFLVPALLFPSWIIVRAFIKQVAEPEPVENLLRRPKPLKPIFYTVLALLIVIGLRLAGLDIDLIIMSAATGEPLYEDPFSSAASGEDLAGAIDALGTMIDEGGRLLIQLLWGG
ncbi:MAG: hypothetical protein F7B18_02555 [Desulfurococcales archaeon]|nr:hypothetical protein [Desulfurococcales archaeon]